MPAHTPHRSYSHSAEYKYIEQALQLRWQPFLQLEEEHGSFSPRPPASFAEERSTRLAHMRNLNPEKSDESLLKDIDDQIAYFARPDIQEALLFNERVMTELVSVAFLSHALCEAAINAILAVGFTLRGTPELFSLIERADIKEKWLSAPRALDSRYALRKDGPLYQTLHHLTQQRNALVHYKIELHVGGEAALSGSNVRRMPLAQQISWMRRYFSLPFDLFDHARQRVENPPIPALLSSGPIERYAKHAET